MSTQRPVTDLYVFDHLCYVSPGNTASEAAHDTAQALFCSHLSAFCDNQGPEAIYLRWNQSYPYLWGEGGNGWVVLE